MGSASFLPVVISQGVLILFGIIVLAYRMGKLTNHISELSRRVEKLESWMYNKMR